MDRTQGSSRLLFIWLLLLFAPLTFAVAIVADLSRALSKSRASFTTEKRLESKSKGKRILITGANDPTALALARMLKGQGHEVIGADVDEVDWLSRARWSRAFGKYHGIRTGKKERDSGNGLVNGMNGAVQSAAEEHHMRTIERIAKSNGGVDLWIPFNDLSTSAASIEVTARSLKRSYGADTIFYNVFVPVDGDSSAEDAFLTIIREYLPSSKVRPPQIVPVKSRDEIHRTLRRNAKGSKWILRNTPPTLFANKALTNGVVKRVRFDLADPLERESEIVMLPEATSNKTYDTISKIRIGKGERWYLCETRPEGKRYISHALVRAGRVRTFLLLSDLGQLQSSHRSFTPVEPLAALHDIVLEFNKYLAKVLSENGARDVSTHFTIEYIIQEGLGPDGITTAVTATTYSPYPHPSLAISTLDRKTWYALANAYTSDSPTANNSNGILTLPSSLNNDTAMLYTLPLLLFSSLVLPVIDFLLLRSSLRQLAQSTLDVANTVVYGKEELFAWEDPWVFWWHWHVAMPLTVAASVKRSSQERVMGVCTDIWGDGLTVWRKALGGRGV